jgi:hypothetical protein
MAIDSQLLEQVLTTPVSRDVRNSPIVTAIILPDPANAAAVVPYLDRPGTEVSVNARRILCLFEANAAPNVAAALQNANAYVRKEGMEVLWAILISEDARTIQDVLKKIAPNMQVLLDDKRLLPGELPDYVEHGFRGRICDFAYVVLRQLIQKEYDPSIFRFAGEKVRDDEIARLRNSSSLNIT